MFSLCDSIIGTFDVGNAERRFRNEIFVEENWNPEHSIVSFYTPRQVYTLYTRASALACENAVGMRQKSRTSDPGTDRPPTYKLGTIV